MDLDAYDFLLKVLAPRPLHRLNLRRMKMHPVFRAMSVHFCPFSWMPSVDVLMHIVSDWSALSAGKIEAPYPRGIWDRVFIFGSCTHGHDERTLVEPFRYVCYVCKQNTHSFYKVSIICHRIKISESKFSRKPVPSMTSRDLVTRRNSIFAPEFRVRKMLSDGFVSFPKTIISFSPPSPTIALLPSPSSNPTTQILSTPTSILHVHRT